MVVAKARLLSSHSTEGSKVSRGSFFLGQFEACQFPTLQEEGAITEP
jgi:hypothetical protein